MESFGKDHAQGLSLVLQPRVELALTPPRIPRPLMSTAEVRQRVRNRGTTLRPIAVCFICGVCGVVVRVCVVVMVVCVFGFVVWLWCVVCGVWCVVVVAVSVVVVVVLFVVVVIVVVFDADVHNVYVHIVTHAPQQLATSH